MDCINWITTFKSFLCTNIYRKQKWLCLIGVVLLLILSANYSQLNEVNPVPKIMVDYQTPNESTMQKVAKDAKVNSKQNGEKERKTKDGAKHRTMQLGAKDKLIVWYNGASRTWNQSIKRTSTCGKYTCTISQNSSDIAKADGVIVNAFYLKPEEKPPQRPHPNQIWMFYCRESERTLDYVRWPSKYWNTQFNWTITYRSDSDFKFPYGAIVKRNGAKKDWLKIAKSKSKSALWIVSHCKTFGRREDYVKRLQQYGVQVDIYGKCGKLKCPQTMERNCFKNYRFYLAFESQMCDDYVTEKFFKVFKHDVVPVVRGGADYSSLLPSNSFIDASNFKTPEDLGKYLLYLDKNDTAYAQALENKSKYGSVHPQPWCDICKHLHQLPAYRKTYPDIGKWLDIKKCYQTRDL
ncbi:alpha-(1,3)-fucosyltransferase C-like isoform X1 [Gigantopelta aegis]|uniref:alpha-(1,3)-fucosyltransferase C-like isoform X1 n=1 Tax=Gigantopelta aegis TaxID=1735272 RepID=UPI001B887E26|nr:alpha-(1,3)-fucosyltransferase C-like isoform X1 [Gigantopelta aegis]